MALMTGAAVMSALRPLSRRQLAAPDGDVDVRFYEQQLTEIERELAGERISREEADAARAEAGRRLLRASGMDQPRTASATGEPALRRRRAAAAFALSIVPIVGLAVYGALGSPRLALPQEPSVSAAPGSDLRTALLQIQDHLRLEPGDLRGWDIVAPIYLRLGQLEEAGTAYANALRLGGDTVERLTGFGEALVSQADGTVGTDAADAFGRVLKLDPNSPQARFYLALAAEQAGNLSAARTGYAAVLRDAPEGAPWISTVQARLAGLPGQMPAAPGGLNAQSVTPAIAGMVSSLDQRLQASGGSEGEWGRLVRSYVVLGQRDEALDRLRRAKMALAADPGADGRLDQLARDLGLVVSAGDRR